MSTSDDWERWLHLGGATDAGGDAAADADAAGDSDAAGDADADAAGDAAGAGPLVIDDPWGALDVALTPLTDAQREHLRLAEPTLLDELVELDRHGAAGDGRSLGIDAGAPWSDELSAAFEVIDEIDEIDDIDDIDDIDEIDAHDAIGPHDDDTQR